MKELLFVRAERRLGRKLNEVERALLEMARPTEGMGLCASNGQVVSFAELLAEQEATRRLLK